MSKKVKMTGAEFRAFWNADWSDAGPAPIVEGEVVVVNGNRFGDDEDGDSYDLNPDTIDPAAKVEIVSGVIVPDETDIRSEKYVDLVGYARRWLKKRGVKTIVFEVPNDISDEFCEYAKKFGRGVEEII